MIKIEASPVIGDLRMQGQIVVAQLLLIVGGITTECQSRIRDGLVSKEERMRRNWRIEEFRKAFGQLENHNDAARHQDHIFD